MRIFSGRISICICECLSVCAFAPNPCCNSIECSIVIMRTCSVSDISRYGSGSSQTSQSSGDICRICHCESDLHNPLLTPCYCSGSLKYVHQTCLQQWLTASETNSCELCKFPFIMHTKIKPFNEVTTALLAWDESVVYEIWSFFAVGESGDVGRGASPFVLCGTVPLCGRHLCDLVVVCVDRTGRRGGEARSDR